MQGFKSNQEKLYTLAIYAEQNHRDESVKALRACGYAGPFDDVEDSLVGAIIMGTRPAVDLINKLAKEQDIKFQYLEKNKDGKYWNLLEVPEIHKGGDSRPDGNNGWWEIVRQHKPPFQTF